MITGGALGIGQGIVRGFVAEGAAVAIADTNRPAADALAAELTSAGGRVIATTTDVSRSADAEAAVAATLAAFGRLDVLVNNAGIQPIDQYKPLHLMPEEVWDRILDVNLKGAFLMTRSAVPSLLASGHGVIVNMASVQGLQSMPGVGPYAASKGGAAVAHPQPRPRVRAAGLCAAWPSAPAPSTRRWCAPPPAPRGVTSRRRSRATGDAPAGAHRHAGGHRERGRVPGQRQGQLHHGRLPVRRRRLHGPGRLGVERRAQD